MDLFWLFLMIVIMLPWVAVAAILFRQQNFQDISSQITVLSTSVMEMRNECRSTSSSSREAPKVRAPMCPVGFIGVTKENLELWRQQRGKHLHKKVHDKQTCSVLRDAFAVIECEGRCALCSGP
jgi:hypothetical protein